jgi:hypothetical protein
MQLTQALDAYSASEKRITYFWGVSTSLTVIVIGGLLALLKDGIHLDAGPKIVVSLVYAIAHLASMIALLAEYKVFVALAAICQARASEVGSLALGDALKGWFGYRARLTITIAIHLAYQVLVNLLLWGYSP